MSISASEARKTLFPLIERVNQDHDAIEIISRKGNVVLMPADEYAAWQETAYLFRSPANARSASPTSSVLCISLTMSFSRSFGPATLQGIDHPKTVKEQAAMAHASKIPSFKPDADWYDDWPYGTDTLVQAQAELAGSGAAQGLNSFLATLIVATTSHAASGVGTYYRGG